MRFFVCKGGWHAAILLSTILSYSAWTVTSATFETTTVASRGNPALLPSSHTDKTASALVHSKPSRINKRQARSKDTNRSKRLATSESIPIRGGSSAAASSNKPLADILGRAKVGFYFALWYALNIVYNIVNKKVLNVWPAPMTVGSLQLGIGALYAMLVWTLRLRQPPKVFDPSPIRKVGFWHAAGQLCTMMSLGAGPVSFTHIVKAMEPFFSAVVSALVFGKWMNPAVYSTLLPVVGGVGYACLKERAFSWLAFGMAMGSNLAFALRAVLSKVAMSSGSIGTNLTPPNVFGLVTLAAFVISIPMALLGEGQGLAQSWSDAVESQGAMELIKGVFLSGIFHYLNNEVMYLALGSVHPVTLAVGNTMKRVFIMVASVAVFGNEISFQAGLGSAIGIGGVLLYSLTKQYYEKLESQTTRKQK